MKELLHLNNDNTKTQLKMGNILEQALLIKTYEKELMRKYQKKKTIMSSYYMPTNKIKRLMTSNDYKNAKHLQVLNGKLACFLYS